MDSDWAAGGGPVGACCVPRVRLSVVHIPSYWPVTFDVAVGWTRTGLLAAVVHLVAAGGDPRRVALEQWADHRAASTTGELLYNMLQNMLREL
jgi:hypothetical protein